MSADLFARGSYLRVDEWRASIPRERFEVTMFLADAVSGFFSGVFFLGFLAVFVASAVWFFRGPATAADRYVDGLALQFQNPQEAALFRSVYKTKDPKSTTVAWLLTVFLSPTIGYLYQQKWALAAISFLTFQGFLVWWLVAIFTTPLEVLSRNKRLADEAFNQVMIGRGGGAFGQQHVINVNQYAYLPPGQAPASSSVPDAANLGAPATPPPAPPAPDVPSPAVAQQPSIRILENGPIAGPITPYPNPQSPATQ